LSPNPLLNLSELPDFATIRAEHVIPALQETLAHARRELQRLSSDLAPPTWQALVIPLEQLRERINEMFSPVGHLHGVADSEPLREAFDEAVQLLTDWETEFRQSGPLYARLKALSARATELQLDAIQRKMLNDELQAFELSGVALEPAAQAEFKAVALKLSEASTQFEQNVLDATEAFRYEVTDLAELDGLSDEVINAAWLRGDSTRHVLDLKAPTYIAVQTYARNRSLRERFYRASATRASDLGQFDNTQLLLNILRLRRQEAALLGFNDFVELSLTTKMAPSAAAVAGFLDDLAARARPSAGEQLQTLSDFAREELGIAELKSWDVAFAQEALKLKLFSIDDERLKPYFPAERTVLGLFELAESLFGVRFVERLEVPRWHADVRYFELRDSLNALVGGVYLDLYARTGKRGGAWMDVCRTRSKIPALKIPVAYLTLNASPPSSMRPSLFSHDDVVTLFHEFGHGIHHLLSEVDYPSVSGVNGVEWDAVELPSQFFENFCYVPEVLQKLGRHFETGQPLPLPWIESIIASKQFMAGLQLLRQVEFALLDLQLHQADPAPATLEEVLAVVTAIREKVALLKPPAFNRATHSFTHIFSGGYAAGYYSYLWAELLSSDAFGMLLEGSVLAPELNAKFRLEVLARGGSRSARENFFAFRGRDPEPTSLLQSYGLAA